MAPQRRATAGAPDNYGEHAEFAPEAQLAVDPAVAELLERWFGIGDAAHRRRYAYVEPWTPRTGGFWNASFGALRDADELPDAAAVTEFFAEGRRLAA